MINMTPLDTLAMASAIILVGVIQTVRAYKKISKEDKKEWFSLLQLLK